MTPEIRAIADRFIYEQATVKLIAALAPEGALDRSLVHPTLGQPDVRAMLQHLALALRGFSDDWTGWLRGASGFRLGWTPCDLAAKAYVATRSRPNPGKPQLMEMFGSGLNSLIATLAATSDDRVHEETGGGQALEVLQRLSGHCLSHAIPLLDALPEVRMDPLVLNWLLHAEFTSEADKKWQADLLAEAREYIATHPDEEEDE